MRTCRGRTWQPSLLLALVFVSLSAQGANSQEAEASPTFRTQAEMVRVDVVVRDRKGQPVTDLEQAEFRVFEDNVLQTIESFESVRRVGAVEAASRPAGPFTVSTNAVTPGAVGQILIVLFDDLHLSPLNANRAKAALDAFLGKAAHDGDVVVLASTSGAYWTTRLPEGRADLLAVVRSLEGRRVPTATMDVVTDYEAMKVHLDNDTAVGDRLARRLRSYQVDRSPQHMGALQDDERLRSLPGLNEPYVELRCAEHYSESRRLTLLTLAALRRTLGAVTGSPGRKGLLFVSEGFVNDQSIDELREAVEAARRANTAVYFVDVRGLGGLPDFMTAAFGRPVEDKDYAGTLANDQLDAEGSAVLAETTGGFSVRRSNDLEDAFGRVAQDSRAYYHLGYVPKNARRDGRYRSIRVQVARPNTTLRARKGYYAARDAPRKARPDVDGIDADAAEALDAPVAKAGIPLRASAYVFGATMAGQARVKIAIEFDVASLDFAQVDGKLVNRVELVCVAAGAGATQPQRWTKTVELTLEPEALERYRESWYPFDQEFELGSGRQQARVFVRDASGRVGTLIHEFEVPPLGALRVSTPVVTDVAEIDPDLNQPTAVPVARRRFRVDRPLYLQFEVFGASSSLSERPLVNAGYEIRGSGGVVVRQSGLKRIQPTSIGALSRLIQIPANALGPGDYELVIAVENELANQRLEILDHFTTFLHP